MPANLTPEYHRAEQAFREARTIEEKGSLTAVSTTTGHGLDDLRRLTFELFDVIRVYTGVTQGGRGGQGGPALAPGILRGVDPLVDRPHTPRPDSTSASGPT